MSPSRDAAPSRSRRSTPRSPQRLAAAELVRPEDLIVSVVHNDREDWSFGHGRAQFLTGEL